MADPTPATTQPEAEKAKVATDPKTGQELTHVKLYSPYQTYYNDEAFSVSAINQTGPFDILPRHHNFMTLLSAGEIIIRAPSGERRVKIARAVMHVKQNKVTIFLDV